MKLNAQELRKLDACDDGLQKFVAAHGESTVFIVDAFDSNGLDDVCWYLSKVTLTSKQERELRLFACDCAERVLHIYEDKHPNDSRPRDAINTARRYANGEATKEELDAAADAAAWAATADAAADAAAWAATRAARAAAAWAAWAADIRETQDREFRQMLVKWCEG